MTVVLAVLAAPPVGVKTVLTLTRMAPLRRALRVALLGKQSLVTQRA